jgi:hypothetical protein
VAHPERVKLPLAPALPDTPPPYPDVPGEALVDVLVEALVEPDTGCAFCWPDMS